MAPLGGGYNAGSAGGILEATDEADSNFELLQREGYVVVKGVLNAEECEALRTHVLLCTDEGLRAERYDLFGNIQEADNRSDLKLDLCEPVVKAMDKFAQRCGHLLKRACGGDARIVELAAISSSKGAVAQPVHADTMHGVTRFLQSDIALPDAGPRDDVSEDEDADEDVGQIVKAVATETAMIFTSLLALQDVEPQMGPTHVWPGTNTVEHHATLWGTNISGKLSVLDADKAFNVDHRKMTLRRGDLVLYDSRTMHCGGANMSDQRRSVFCVSTMGPGIRPDGTTWTMLSSLRGRFKLSDLPLGPARVTAPTASSASNAFAALPAAADADSRKPDKTAGLQEGEARPIPPLEEWEACVQCSFCGKWRPCGALEAPKLMGADSGFSCKMIRFSCNQEQKYTQAEIDEIF
mmetsp:Transcript_36620/g.66393  ORF Transcript_36620/g.66393 Transcript_36620/m.66393 type:complete len:409 (+) Transcript_36620:54-1280(+)|eukprot:CAMPEP_0197624950 /NCGR_PEP_ID=MMETSP1338-20131121/4437_1 /TAXON_ID=43686 ORGANISM="Pelagodinium beii, Strain RCC1491" /NCGR_SAMPLE_ID=MMETSP1338 /ASSEMBLY_ACC=CAM_ASM_000754 /LENGTH=408 /DNA_ID=CAMNT_0043195217 /DNA_START=47 /DNA_END=1273 /DNA_ORIENTATION=-